MADRSVYVRLRLDISDYQRKAALAEAETEALARGLEHADKNVSAFQKSSNGAGKEVDKLSGRLGILRDAAVVLGPVLIPLGGSAIPALTAALGGLGAAAGGIGVAVLALHGIGAGLKAIDAYQLEPTAENLAKLRAEMTKLGPAGANFARFLDDIEPKLKGLQMTARNGLFPGTEAGITDLLTRLPEVRQVVNRLSQEMGDLAKDAGSALAGPEWTPFFNYVKKEAAPTLDAFARSTGNVALGLANLLVAFTPLSNRFTGGLVGMTAAFANWSKGLDQNQGFQNFLDYLEKTGPDVLALLGGLAQAFAGIVHAAAPLGQSTLPVLNALLKVFGGIANSPIGPGLYAAVAGLLAFNRAAKITSASTTKLTAAMSTMSKVRLASGVVGGLGLLALSATNVDDKLGLASTSMDAMAGLMVGGPWGAAIGAGVGLMTDLGAASDRAASSQDALDKAFARSSTSYVDRVATLKKANADYVAQTNEFQTHGFSNFLKHPADQLNYALSSFDGSTVVDDLGKQASVSNVALDSMNKSLVAIGASLGNPAILAGSRDFSTLKDVATTIQPALSALGLSLNDLSVTKLTVFGHAVASTAGDVRANRAAVVDWVKSNDSAAGRSKVLTDAVAGLDNKLVSTAQSANAVSEALNSLLGPQLNLSEATDAWTTSLRHLSDDLDKNNHSIVGNSDAAIQNRAAVRDRVTAMTDVLSAEAAAGASSGTLTKHLQSQRQALIEAGKAAGISKDDMVAYLDKLNLTPKLVKTLIEANTDDAKNKLGDIAHLLANLHDKTVKVTISEQRVGPGGQGHGYVTPSADGSMVPKGGVYADRYLYALAPGEQVISNRHGQADRFRADTAAGRIPGYADGGTTGGWSPLDHTYARTNPGGSGGSGSSSGGHDPVGHEADSTAAALRRLKARLDEATKTLDAERQSRKDLITAEQDFGAQVGLAYSKADLFSGDITAFDTGAQANANDSAAAQAALAQAAGQGLDGPLYQALAASGNSQLVQQFAALSPAEIAQREAEFAAQSNAQGALGQTAIANSQFPQLIKDQTREIAHQAATNKELTAAVKAMQAQLRHVGSDVQAGAAKGIHQNQLVLATGIRHGGR